nr:T-complex protein 1 subunit gamma-like [Danaus plexippus plexippus]
MDPVMRFVSWWPGAIRRLRKTDNNRLARACGATIVNRTEELKESDVGTQAGRFEIKKIGDDYFTFVTECKNPKACTILLRGASKDILNEIERNLQDALHVAKNLVLNPRLVCGGGAVEMSVSGELASKAHHAAPYRAVAQALEIIPRTLAQNCGANTIRTLTALRAKHAAGERNCGIDGETGLIVDMAQKGIWEPLAVKLQVYKTAVETAIFLLRIDDIVSGSKKKNKEGANPAEMANMQE